LDSRIANKQLLGRTIPSFRIASDIQIWKRRPFRKMLDKQDRKKFDEMLSVPRLYNSAGTMACRPVLIHVILISKIFEHYKLLTKLVGIKISNNRKSKFEATSNSSRFDKQ
jgi:hypothetical protein